MVDRRKPKNPAESQFFDLAKKHGVRDATKKGWPDFRCLLPSGEWILVEIKPRASSRLKIDQMLSMRFFASKGIRCYQWSPAGGFCRVNIDGSTTSVHSSSVFREQRETVGVRSVAV